MGIDVLLKHEMQIMKARNSRSFLPPAWLPVHEMMCSNHGWQLHDVQSLCIFGYCRHFCISGISNAWWQITYVLSGKFVYCRTGTETYVHEGLFV